MHIKPEIAFFIGETAPIYKCKCGERFSRMTLLENKPIKGIRDYCPNCKNKLNFN